MRRRASLLLALALPVLAALPACEPDPSPCPARGSGEVRMAIVVDARALGGSRSVVCVVLPAGSDGLDGLRARARRLGTAAPRLDQSGLVCAIDGRPAAPACGESGPDGYEYWSYWLGGSRWRYASIGPSGRGVQDGAVDGWRFLRGGAPVAPDTPSSFAALTS